ncbi:MAG: three-Cys-motif partner protein TcmP [Halobacteriaceae archaeon]
MAPEPDIDWIIENLELLTTEIDGIVKAGGEIETEFRAMTVLKLAVVAATVDIYSKVAMDKFERCYYIDALAGAGVTRLRNHDEYVLGSPIVAPLVARDEFFENHFVEFNSKRAQALNNRLEYVSSLSTIDYPYKDCVVHDGQDCNEVIPSIVDSIRSQNPKDGMTGVNLLTIVDNSGVDADWEMVKSVADVWGDLLITFPATRISSNRGKWVNEGREDKAEENDIFFGTTEWRKCDTEQEYLQLYCERLESLPEVERLTRTIEVHSGPGGGRFYYPLIYCTRKTSGGSPYTNAIEFFKERMERLDGSDVTSAIDLFLGEQSDLDEWT